MVEYFIDSSNIDEIKKWGFLVTGCTTNPKILSSDRVDDIESRIKQITEIIKGPISVEIFSETYDEMLFEAMKYAFWHKNIVIKVPVLNYDSLKLIRKLEEKNIHVNATACISLNQVILAAMAGASYISIFYGRAGDEGNNPEEIIKESVKILNGKSKIIVGSIRSVLDVNRSVMSGADIITITPQIMEKLVHNAKTVETINEFNESYKNFIKEK
jgi:transaldolase